VLDHLNPQPKAPERVVIMGAKGFVGGALAGRLARDGVPVLALGRAQVDLRAADAAGRLAAMLRPDDAFVAVSALAPCKDSTMLVDNMVMARAMVQALAKAPVAHVVNISSDAVYADSAQPLTEGSCAEPGSLHGAMHLAREIVFRAEIRSPLAVLRPTLLYGLKDPHNGYGPNRFRRQAAAGTDIVLFGEGEEQRDHVDIEDVVTLLVSMLRHRSVGVLNAASGEVVSFRDLAEFVADDFVPRVIVRTTPRTGPMPHRGYRAFNNEAVVKAFPDFRFTPWRRGLGRVHASIKGNE
jgi:UDP-glucose 4-epimerase